MGNSNRIMTVLYFISMLALPAAAAAAKEGDITSMWGLIGDPIAAFNNLDSSTKGMIQWALALVVIATIICVFFGISKNTMKTAIGAKNKDAKMSTSGITDNIGIVVTVIVGTIVLGVAIAILTGLGK